MPLLVRAIPAGRRSSAVCWREPVGSPRAPRSSEGWRSLDRARASIWRIRSRVRLKTSPDLILGAGLARIQAEAQPEDLPLPLVEATSILLASVMDLVSVASEGLARLTSPGDNAEADFS